MPFLVLSYFVHSTSYNVNKKLRKKVANMAGHVAAIRLTEQQDDFVRAICRGLPPSDAAREAGYGGNVPDYAYRLLRAPAVAAAIRLEITRKLVTEALPLAYNVLANLARDEATPAAVRRACARDLIDRAGFVAPKAVDAVGADVKPLHEMSSDELRGLVDKLESELGARAVDVTPADNAQHSKGGKAKALSFLG